MFEENSRIFELKFSSDFLIAASIFNVMASRFRLETFETFEAVFRDVLKQRLHRYWWRMLETKCVGDKIWMLVANQLGTKWM